MNSYTLRSDKVPDHLMHILSTIQTVVGEKRSYDFILVGAAARDIIMWGIHQKAGGAITNDVDFAIYVPEWDSYHELIEQLVGSGHFTQTALPYRLIFKEKYPVDLVPFGGIQNENGLYTWPPEDITAMTLMGFEEINAGGLSIQIEGKGLQFRVASLPGIIVSKLLAWKDRKLKDNKDGRDIGFIIANYTDINLDILYEQHADVVEDLNFDTLTAGARIAGREVRQLILQNPTALQYIIEILQVEIESPDNSYFARSVAQGASIPYYKAFEAVKGLHRGVTDK